MYNTFFMQIIWDRGFKELNAVPEEHPVFLTDPMLDFVGQRERMIEIMFEKYQLYISIKKQHIPFSALV